MQHVPFKIMTQKCHLSLQLTMSLIPLPYLVQEVLENVVCFWVAVGHVNWVVVLLDEVRKLNIGAQVRSFA